MTGVTRRQYSRARRSGSRPRWLGVRRVVTTVRITAEPYVIDGPDDLGCVDSVSVGPESEIWLWPVEQDFYSVTVSLVGGDGWATVIAEWGNQFEREVSEQTVGDGEASVSFEIDELPSLFRLSVRCSDGGDVNAVFRVVES